MTVYIALLCLFVFLIGSPQALWLWPVDSEHYAWWQWITYGFVHGNVLHLGVNLLALFSFGPTLERQWGRWRFTGMYLGTVFIAGVLQMVATKTNAPLVGASGALFGLFAAYVVAKPKAKITSIFVMPIPAWVLLLVYTAVTMAAIVFHWFGNIAHVAHLAGIAAGIGGACVLNPVSHKRDSD